MNVIEVRNAEGSLRLGEWTVAARDVGPGLPTWLTVMRLLVQHDGIPGQTRASSSSYDCDIEQAEAIAHVLLSWARSARVQREREARRLERQRP